MSKEFDFGAWFFESNASHEAGRLYGKQAEKNITLNLDELVAESYGKNAVGDKNAEDNIFWYEVERLAKEDNMHLKYKSYEE